MKYDYLVVGAGLYGSVFAHEAATRGKRVLVVDKRPNIAGNVYTEDIEESMCTSMVHIFSIPTIKRCGITLQNLRNLTALRIHR